MVQLHEHQGHSSRRLSHAGCLRPLARRMPQQDTARCGWGMMKEARACSGACLAALRARLSSRRGPARLSKPRLRGGSKVEMEACGARIEAPVAAAALLALAARLLRRNLSLEPSCVGTVLSGTG